MKCYEVRYLITRSGLLEIEAESEEDARNRADALLLSTPEEELEHDDDYWDLIDVEEVEGMAGTSVARRTVSSIRLKRADGTMLVCIFQADGTKRTTVLPEEDFDPEETVAEFKVRAVSGGIITVKVKMRYNRKLEETFYHVDGLGSAPDWSDEATAARLSSGSNFVYL